MKPMWTIEVGNGVPLKGFQIIRDGVIIAWAPTDELAWKIAVLLKEDEEKTK